MKTLKALCITLLASISIAAHADSGNKVLIGSLSATNTAFIPGLTTNVVYPISGQTNTYNVPAGASIGSNTNLLVVNTDEYDYAGFTFAFTGTATSTNGLLIYKSFDGGHTFEANASFQYLNITPGAASYVTNAALDIHGATTLAFVVRNTGTTGATNALLELNLQRKKVGAYPVNVK